ncbi:MAG: putative Ig domain-containing protein, partial [Planctomycetota bacterium]
MSRLVTASIAFVLVSIGSSLAFAQQVPTLYYKFNSGSGNVAVNDGTAGPATSTFTATPTWSAPVLGASSKSGAADILSTYGFNLANSFTIEFWLRGTSGTFGYTCGDSAANSFRLFVAGAAGASNIIWRAGGFTDLIIPNANDGNVHHVAYVYDATANTVTGYLDGSQSVQNTGQTGSGTSTNFRIGSQSGGSQFAGMMDDFRLWMTARTSAEIAANYNNELFPGLAVTTPAQLPNAGEGVAYTEIIEADYGTPAYTWAITSGTLPAGLSLTTSSNDFVFSGSPNTGTAGTYNFDVRVTDSTTATFTKSMTLVVEGLKVVNANPLADGQETVAYSETFTAANGPTPYTWSMISGALPSGLSLSQVGQTYELTGTPAIGSTGNYTFELQVVDNNSSVGTKTFDLYIDWAPGALTYPLTQQDPAATGFIANTSSTYTWGWRFKCNSGGVTVYRLGSNVPAASSGVAKTCTLWDVATQQILGQVTTGPGSGGWQWTDLTSPVLLTNGADYCVCMTTTNGYYYDSTAAASWIPTGDIQFLGRQYLSTSNPNTYPPNFNSGNPYQYGVCDIGYAKGLTITTNAQLPSGAEGTSYNTTIVAGFGTPAYSWTHVSGTLPNGLSLSASGNDFVLSGTPATGSLGTYNFTIRVTDTIPDTFDKTMTIFIMPPPATMPFNDDFSSDTGWQMGTGWQRGSATAYSGASPPRTEPGTDSSPSADNNILGHLIGADYTASMAVTDWVTSPPIDCSTSSFVSLRFERWLGCSLGDTAKIQISSNGTTWNDVWTAPTGSNTNDTAWTFSGYDITTWAAGNSVVQVRFGIGPTNTVVNVGWCIDDFQIIDPGPELEVREGGPTGTPITDNEAVGGLRDFGQVLVGQTSGTLNISLYNNGINTINFGAYTKVGANPADFFVITAPASSIAPGMYTYMEVQFYRTTAGVSTCTIELPHDAAGSGTTPFEINLTGEAIPLNPLIQVDMTTSGGTNIPHQNPATGTARDFGNVMVGSSS